MDINALRQKILDNPTDRSAWHDLENLLLLHGEQEVYPPEEFPQYESLAAQPTKTKQFNVDDQNFDLPNEIRLPRLDSDVPEVDRLTPLAGHAYEWLERKKRNHIVLGLDTGTITLATRQANAENAKLFIGEELTHIQVEEQLIYRDPASGLRISCLRMAPVRLEGIRERDIADFTLLYGGEMSTLHPSMPIPASGLRVVLEEWNGKQLTGWMGLEADFIGRTPTLICACKGKPYYIVRPHLHRSDVLQALGNSRNVATGFQVDGLHFLREKDGIEIELRDPITYKSLCSYLLSAYTPIFDRIYQANRGFLGFKAEEHNGVIQILPKISRTHLHTTEVARENKLDILIPVYKGWDLTRLCIESAHMAVQEAIKSFPGMEVYLHVTNDHSPDDEVNKYLPGLCNRLGVIYHENKENLGFIKTVNKFMHGTSADILLLNSDVIVSRACIKEVVRARKSLGSQVASITAFSNNATIYSFPWQIAENPISCPEAVETIAEAFLVTSQDVINATKVPVSHGFLMYITRTALRSIGVFDEYFGMGYGEEVDWAMRAAINGYSHFVCTSAYAFHKGSVSFGESTRLKAVKNSNSIVAERYPFYDRMIHDFIDIDILQARRNEVSTYLLSRSDTSLVVHISHASGGGIDKYITGMKQQLVGMRHVIITHGREYSDLASLQGHSILFKFSMECVELDAGISGGFEREILPAINTIAKSVRLKFILHSFVGWKPDEITLLMNFIKENDIPYDYVSHDYMAVCPRIKLIDSSGKYCGLPEVDKCMHCLRSGDTHPESSLLSPYNKDITLYRNFFKSILQGANTIIVSTRDQHSLLEKAGYSHNTRVIAPFEATFSSISSTACNHSESRNIVILGGVGYEKGAERLFNVASMSLYLSPSIHFYLVGSASNIDKLNSLPNFTHIGAYNGYSELFDMVNRIDNPTAFFPAIWPETWCYTLSEAMMLGLQIIAPNLGAFGERISESSLRNARLYDPLLSDREIALILSE